MKIRVIWVGKTKERSISERLTHYLKLLRPYADVSLIEIKEDRGKGKDESLSAEGKRILKQTTSYVLLDEKGTSYTSQGFAEFLKGYTHIDFVVGGPYGVSGEVRAHASTALSLSRMTLPHDLARLIFFEQLYRAFTIIKGKEYHHA